MSTQRVGEDLRFFWSLPNFGQENGTDFGWKNFHSYLCTSQIFKFSAPPFPNPAYATAPESNYLGRYTQIIEGIYFPIPPGFQHPCKEVLYPILWIHQYIAIFKWKHVPAGVAKRPFLENEQLNKMLIETAMWLLSWEEQSGMLITPLNKSEALENHGNEKWLFQNHFKREHPIITLTVIGYQWSRHMVILSQWFRHKVRVRARQLWG